MRIDNEALDYTASQQHRYLEELSDFIRIPSVSTKTENNADMAASVEWLAKKFHQIGIKKVEIFPTSGHPVLFAEHCHPLATKTVLVYGHYDVQPAEPIELWKSPPFDSNICGENLFGRGASDMKGQILAVINAFEAVNKIGPLKINVKWIIEGEEEIGSPNLTEFIKAHTDMLKSDFALNTDTGMISADTPTITYGLRGLAYFELRVYGPDHDLHSGIFGGVIHNPAQVLCDLIGGMHDSSGAITLPDFYRNVLPIDQDERQSFSKLPIHEQTYIIQTGVPGLWGEEGYTLIERVSARPTLEINGLFSGYTGKGSKTIIPSFAMAKISMRLVPNQDPDCVHQQLISYLKLYAPKTIRWELDLLSAGPAVIVDRDLLPTRAMFQAYQTAWGKDPLFKREGGSIPVTTNLQNILKIESVMTGFGLPDDNIHAPNEKLHLPTWYRGINTLIYFFYNLERMG